MNASELVIQLHDLARETKDNRIRKIADNLAEVARDHSDKGYKESTHEKQAEFARKRDASLNEYISQAQEIWNDSCTAPRKK
jgi:predicted HicB family RNase H-like nuclease